MSSGTRQILFEESTGGLTSTMNTGSVRPSVAYQACFGARLGGISGGKDTQVWRASSHTAIVGGGKFGSAKVPMATATYPGKPSPSQYTVEPHIGQKCKVKALPLSALRVHAVALPAKVICSRRKRAWLLITAPVRRWHSRQWHMDMRTGSPSIVRRRWPQLQVACRAVMMGSLCRNEEV